MNIINSIDQHRGTHTGIPGFFRALCYGAKSGGVSGYSNAGWHLANAIGTQLPWDLDLEEWQEKVETLKLLLAAENDQEVWRWYQFHYPRCMKLVPSRRRGQFVAGVRRAYEEDRIEL